jgi:hypothetical protein
MVSIRETDGRMWRTSSHSGGGNDCVEVAVNTHETAVRDSKNPVGPRLRFTATEWSAFVGMTKHHGV